MVVPIDCRAEIEPEAKRIVVLEPGVARSPILKAIFSLNSRIYVGSGEAQRDFL